jgi:hypothetical protein
MKATLFTLLLASAAVLAPAADSPTVNGKWQVHNNIVGNESDMSCSFTQKEADLTGSCTGDQGTVNITGKVDGKNVNWVYKSEYNGGPITLTYKGTLDGTPKITGSVNVEEYSVEGDFTATPTK